MKKATPNPQKNGLVPLGQYLRSERDAGKQLFRMVLHEEGSAKDLRALVSQPSLLELMLLTIDHQKRARAFANQVKSKKTAGEAKKKARQLLFDWLDTNMSRFSGKLDRCAAEAVLNIRNLGRTEAWARKQITEYRKEKPLALC